MALFVHLTPESRLAQIQRNGLTRLRRPLGERPGGLFAMPVIPNYYLTHQWVRELRRRGQGRIAAVYFRIPDYELVWVGHYNQNYRRLTAAEATAVMMAAKDRQGWEVMIERRIGAKEIQRVRRLPQVIGWRYKPGAHGTKPCPCPFCSGGRYGARRIREKFGH